jgi:isoquinoline 1-oxidoreductase beta subunit
MRAEPPSSAAADLSRRTILKAATAGGLLLGFRLHPLRALAAEAADNAVFAPNAFVRIGRDGKVTMIMPQVEMGQGTYTSMPMLIAEELEVDLGQVGLEPAPPDDRLYVNPLLGLQATGLAAAGERGGGKSAPRARGMGWPRAPTAVVSRRE